MVKGIYIIKNKILSLGCFCKLQHHLCHFEALGVSCRVSQTKMAKGESMRSVIQTVKTG